ncbi:1-phosphofructokinase [Ruminococcus flavefaciens]|uniref:Tagatose-6-phosphate kinase n=1 Tax=Ruminococcus flavefaciens TaxID=1265 RepID=A0A1M7MSE4_RUMFL|nr:1-phosphofructokinase [Ruminococcus flavefaciens]SHM93874.1 fructose-1-phosphate kinase [Ruminococcus flavefaciens]
MIYTVTFNPAIDYVLRTDRIQPGCVNRSESEEIFFGGKGINVSAVLAELGIKSKALGFTAGFTGEAIEQGVKDMGIDADFVRLKSGSSRINVKIKADKETEINGQGPHIDSESIGQLMEKLDEIQDGDTLVLAGSIPNSLPDDIYEKILSRLSDRDIRIVADASKRLLMNMLKYRPFLIKPNNFELSEIFGVNITTYDEIVEHAVKLQAMGAGNVLVSMAEKGAVLLDETGKLYKCGACTGTVKNSVGAGDSMLAGFIAGVSEGYDYALKLGTACGGATAFSDGLAKKELIDKLMEQL